MYNLHQYNQSVRNQSSRRTQEQRFAKYLLKHQCTTLLLRIQGQSSIKTKRKTIFLHQRGIQFMIKQTDSPKNFVFQDDHYKHWRPLKQFRDIEDNNKFLSHKVFRHKPNYDMGKFFNERERKQILNLSLRKQKLVKSQVIPQELRSRSLRSQGPLNPKLEFRETKNDKQYLQPRLRFSNITDKQRMNESMYTYDDKFKSLYESVEIKKSQIGRTVVSPSKQRYDDKGKLQKSQDLDVSMADSKNFFFSRQQSPILSPKNQSPDLTFANDSPTLSKLFKINPQVTFSSKFAQEKKSKTYFKLAKSMQLRGKVPEQQDAIQELLKKSQFQRKRDLTNLKNNTHYENFAKRPIL